MVTVTLSFDSAIPLDTKEPSMNATFAIDIECESFVVRCIEMIFLGAMFFVGAFYNIHIFQLMHERAPAFMKLPEHFQKLQRNLNVADICVVFVYIPSEFCRLIDQPWQGGPVLCKLTHFTDSFCFHAVSNVLVVIAFNRCISAFGQMTNTTLTALLAVAWILAFIFSLPQLYLWSLIKDPTPKCVPLILAQADQQTFALTMTYGIFHICAVFWIPMGLLVIFYTILIIKLFGLKYLLDKFRPTAGIGEQTCLTATKSSTNHTAYFVRANTQSSAGEHTVHVEFDVSVQQPDCSSQPQPDDMIQQQKYAYMKAIRITSVLVLTYVVCWLPYNVLSLRGDQCHYYMLVYNLIVCNSVLNPFLYGIGRE